MKKFFSRAKIKKLALNMVRMMVIYVMGSLIFVSELWLRSRGKSKVKTRGPMPRLRQGTIVIANHPDGRHFMWEIFQVPSLFIPQAFGHPIRLSPRIPADKINFSGLLWGWFYRLFSIPIVRRGKRFNGYTEAREEVEEMIGVLASGGIIITFIEPGRTCTGTRFVYSRSGRNRIREVSDTIGLLASKVKDAHFIFVWVSRDKEIVPEPGKKLWGRLDLGEVVTIGFSEMGSRQIAGKKPAEITTLFVNELLDLADQIK